VEGNDRVLVGFGRCGIDGGLDHFEKRVGLRVGRGVESVSVVLCVLCVIVVAFF